MPIFTGMENFWLKTCYNALIVYSRKLLLAIAQKLPFLIICYHCSFEQKSFILRKKYICIYTEMDLKSLHIRNDNRNFLKSSVSVSVRFPGSRHHHLNSHLFILTFLSQYRAIMHTKQGVSDGRLNNKPPLISTFSLTPSDDV